MNKPAALLDLSTADAVTFAAALPRRLRLTVRSRACAPRDRSPGLHRRRQARAHGQYPYGIPSPWNIAAGSAPWLRPVPPFGDGVAHHLGQDCEAATAREEQRD